MNTKRDMYHNIYLMGVFCVDKTCFLRPGHMPCGMYVHSHTLSIHVYQAISALLPVLQILNLYSYVRIYAGCVCTLHVVCSKAITPI